MVLLGILVVPIFGTDHYKIGSVLIGYFEGSVLINNLFDQVLQIICKLINADGVHGLDPLDLKLRLKIAFLEMRKGDHIEDCELENNFYC